MTRDEASLSVLGGWEGRPLLDRGACVLAGSPVGPSVLPDVVYTRRGLMTRCRLSPIGRGAG